MGGLPGWGSCKYRERIWKGGLREWLESNLRIKGMTERACKPFCVSAFAGQLKVAI